MFINIIKVYNNSLGSNPCRRSSESQYVLFEVVEVIVEPTLVSSSVLELDSCVIVVHFVKFDRHVVVLNDAALVGCCQ